MSKYLAYPFLYDNSNDLRCDYEIFTDEISSTIGLLRAFVNNEELKNELTQINDLVYHMNASLRTKVSVTKEELLWLENRTNIYQEEIKDRIDKFVVPQGCISASYAHVIRTKFKALVRLLHRHKEQGNTVDEILFDFANLFSGYFFILALKLNKDEKVDETEFVSRNYK
ncbi:ATP:cob(I)alamin adenosyltransferase [Romboutsia sp.]|uniref:ATP:cob(I)alamin adenosyltransferase n=1 Tax=Romboutsia sp. TaxID=1965302 RepID=UPI003F3EE10F